MGAVEGSEEDSYRFNPCPYPQSPTPAAPCHPILQPLSYWKIASAPFVLSFNIGGWGIAGRAPGYAPVVDPCGQAGGKYKNQSIGGDSIFYTTPFATMGDFGSNLPPSVNKTKWVAGTYVEVAWGPLYNHGGGYQYRLCPADEALTEECFRRTPLEFDRTKQTMVWNTKAVPGADGTTPPVPKDGTLRFPVPNPVFVDEGTWPQGSTWARDPIPRINDNNLGLYDPSSCPGPTGRSGPGCLQFPSPCAWDHGMFNCTGLGCHGNGMGACSSDWVVGLISDRVLIPKDLKAGDYVLSWRWDCEVRPLRDWSFDAPHPFPQSQSLQLTTCIPLCIKPCRKRLKSGPIVPTLLSTWRNPVWVRPNRCLFMCFD